MSDPLVWHKTVRKGVQHQVAFLDESIVGHIWCPLGAGQDVWTASLLCDRDDTDLQIIASVFPDPATARDCVERGLRLVGILPPRTADVE